MPNSFIKTFVKFSSILSFIIFLNGLLTLYVWIKQPQYINDLHKKIKRYYLSYYEAKYSQAQSTSDISAAEELLEKLKDTRKLDRLDPILRKSFKLTIQKLLERSEWQKALSWAKKWVLFDNKDLFAKVRLAQILYAIPSRKSEGIKQLAGLFEKFPNIEFICQAYVNLLQKEGDLLAAFQAINKYINFYTFDTMPHWKFYWDSGPGYSEQNSHFVTPDLSTPNSLKLVLNLPPEVKNLRIDLPSLFYLYLSDPQFEVKGQCSIKPKLSINNDMSSRGNNTYVTIGRKDPFFSFSVPANCSSAKFEGIFTVKIYKSYARWIVKFLNTPKDYMALKEILLVQNKQDELKQLEIIYKDFAKYSKQLYAYQKRRLNFLKKEYLELFWSSKKRVFSESFKKRELLKGGIKNDQLSFKVDFKVKQFADTLRIDFPEEREFNYKIKQISILSNNSVEKIDFNNLALDLKNNIKKNGHNLIIVGNDPFFSFSLKDKKFIDSVQIYGQVEGL